MNQRHQSANTDLSGRHNERLAYIAPPGVSITSLLVNIPWLLSNERSSSSVILMDLYDYNRIREQALQQESSQTCQYLLMAFNELHRRGIIRFIDYTDFYQRYIQRTTLRQNQALIEAIPDSIHRRTAIHANNNWIKYGRGTYQGRLRAGLGDQGFTDARQLDETRSQMMDRGRGAPVEWNKRVLNRYTTALTVRQQADDVLNLDVQYVIGEGESTLMSSILDETDTAFDTSHVEHLKPTDHIEELTAEKTTTTRELFDTIGKIAVEMTGVQHDDWVVLGPTFAIPQYADLFDFSTIQDEISSDRDKVTLTEEVRQVISTLEQEAKNGLSPSKITYNADWISETVDLPLSIGRSQPGDFTELIDYALNLARSSRDLRTLVDQGEVSQAAALIGVSIVNDPSHDHDRDTIDWQSRHLISQINPPDIEQSQIDANLRRKEVWDHEPDWYEVADRAR